jgi:hypothetical protein
MERFKGHLHRVDSPVEDVDFFVLCCENHYGRYFDHWAEGHIYRGFVAPVQAQAWAEDCGFHLKVTAEEPTKEGSASFCDEVEGCPFCPSFKPVQKVPDRVFTPLAKGRMFLSIDFLICGVGHLYGLLRLLSDDDSEADESRDYDDHYGRQYDSGDDGIDYSDTDY